jgi:integrase
LSHIEDRWFRTVTGPDGKRVRLPSDRHGTGKRYRVRYVDANRRARTKSFDRKGAADNFKIQVDADLLRGTYIDPTAGKISLRRYAGTWLDAQTFDESTRENTARRLRLHVYPVLGDRTLAQLAASPSSVQAWIRGTGLSAGTAQGVFSLLSSVMNAAIDDGLIQRNPCRARSVRPPRPDKRKLVPWKAAAVDAVRAALPPRYRALTDAGRGLGLRQGEAFGLAVDDIDFLRRVVHVRRQVKRLGNGLVFGPPKGGQERDVPLPGSVALRLSAHIAEFPPVPVELPWRVLDGDPVTARLLFTNGSSRAIKSSVFDTTQWHPALRVAGIVKARENGFHALRHYFASVLLYDGVDIGALAEYLGHRDPGFTLRIYVHLMPDAADRMRAVVDNALSPPADVPAASPPPFS